MIKMPVYDYDSVPWEIWKLLKKYRVQKINHEYDISATNLLLVTDGGAVDINEYRLPYPEDLKYSDKIMSIRAIRFKISNAALDGGSILISGEGTNIEDDETGSWAWSIHLFDVDQVAGADFSTELHSDEIKTALERWSSYAKSYSNEAEFTSPGIQEKHLDVLVVFLDDVDFVVNPVIRLALDTGANAIGEQILTENYDYTVYYKEKKLSRSSLESIYSIMRTEA